MKKYLVHVLNSGKADLYISGVPVAVGGMQAHPHGIVHAATRRVAIELLARISTAPIPETRAAVAEKIATFFPVSD